MAIYQVQQVGAEVLREKCEKVTVVDDTVRRLLDDLADTMYDADGVGLAAPQIGVAKRVIVVDVGDGLIEFINPVLKNGKGSAIDDEGCLSVKGFFAPVPRYKSVTVEGLDREGRPQIMKAKDFKARALQHEIDHLDGILFIDKMIKEKE